MLHNLGLGQATVLILVLFDRRWKVLSIDAGTNLVSQKLRVLEDKYYVRIVEILCVINFTSRNDIEVDFVGDGDVLGTNDLRMLSIWALGKVRSWFWS